MLYKNVCIESLGYALPEKIIPSTWIESQLEPVYKALGLEPGFLEQVTGVAERRWWEESEDMSFADIAAMAGEAAIRNAGIDKNEVQILINASVCRDYVEPAGASITHHKLGLGHHCRNFDVTNACMGFGDAITIVADMIELGHIDTGLIVAGECSREITESTIDFLLKAEPSFPVCFERMVAFTFGSGGVAMVLRSKDASKTKKQLLGGFCYADTKHSNLCVGQRTWITIRAKEMLKAGLKPLARAWDGFLKEVSWNVEMIDRIFSHQVSSAHRSLGAGVLDIDLDKDYFTLPKLGNIGPVSSSLCMAMALEEGLLKDGDRLCLMSMGSGINCMFLGIQW